MREGCRRAPRAGLRLTNAEAASTGATEGVAEGYSAVVQIFVVLRSSRLRNTATITMTRATQATKPINIRRLIPASLDERRAARPNAPTPIATISGSTSNTTPAAMNATGGFVVGMSQYRSRL